MTYAGRLASDSQRPPPISTPPEARASHLARWGFMNQARPRPEATRPGGVGRSRHQRRHDAHHRELTPGWQRRVDELRQEGGEEDDRLRVGQRHDETPGEMDVVGDRQGIGRLRRAAPRLDAEIDQIGRARPAHRLEQDERIGEHPRQAEGDRRQQQRVAERRARHRRQRRPHAARRAGRNDQRDDRPRRDDEDQGDQQKGGEEMVIHLNPPAAAPLRAT